MPHSSTTFLAPRSLGRCVHLALASLALIGAAPQAFAQAPGGGSSSQVSLYGVLDAGYYRRNLAGEATVSRVDSGLLSMPRWGMRGSEDLGGGLSAAFDIGGHFRMDTGEAGRHPGDTAAGRYFSLASWVGLRGGFGFVRLGRIPTGTYITTLQFSPFAESVNLGPFLMHTITGSQPMNAVNGSTDGIWSNSIAYTSPTFGGLSGSLQYVPSEASTEGRRMDVTVNYRQQAFAAALNHRRVDRATITAPRAAAEPAGAPYVIQETQSTLASVSYDFNVVKVFGQYSSGTVQARGLPEIGLDTLGLSAQVPVGAGRIVASWARTKREQAGVSDRVRSTLSAGYIHSLSKRTDLYGVAIADRATNLRSGTGLALGIRHSF